MLYVHQKKIHYPDNLTFHDNHLACLEVLYLYLFKFWDNKFHMVIRQRIIQSNSPKLSVSCLRQLDLRQPKLIFRRASQQFPPVSNISPLACNCDLCQIQSRNAKHQHWFNRSLMTRKTHTIASEISGKQINHIPHGCYRCGDQHRAEEHLLHASLCRRGRHTPLILCDLCLPAPMLGPPEAFMRMNRWFWGNNRIRDSAAAIPMQQPWLWKKHRQFCDVRGKFGKSSKRRNSPCSGWQLHSWDRSKASHAHFHRRAW